MLKFLSNKKVLTTTLACLLGSSLLSTQVLAADNKDTFSDQQKVYIESIIHDYIVSHPEILVEAAKALEAKQAQGQQAALKEAVDFFIKDKNTPVRGSRSAKNYVVEFFDYNCGYCKVVRPLTKELQEKHDVVIYYVELPILSPLSVKASAIGLALYQQDAQKYFVYQDELMQPKVKITSEDQIKAAVKKAGGNYDALSKAINDNKVIQESLRKNMEISQQIGVQGTPFFIVNGQVIRGAVKDYATFEQILKDSQAKK